MRTCLYPSRFQRRGLFLSGVGALLIPVGCGVTLPGTPGPPGPPGPPGLDAGSDLPGTVVTILDVNGGVPVRVGDSVVVAFTLETRAGRAIPIDDIDRFSIYVSGPATNYQRVIVPEGDVSRVTDLGNGEFTYRFGQPFPATYAAPPNDSPAFGPEDGELTGLPIAAGTYTLGIEARRTFMIEGETVRDAGDATLDFSVGGAPILPRQVVLESNCNRCHAQLTLHGGNRFSVTGCVLCHITGGEDRVSNDPAKQTPDVRIQFANMIHAIHRGAGLPNVEATANSEDPFRLEFIGFGESVNDFSHVQFPVMPGGTGFNEQVRNCNFCHGGAADGDRAFTNPTQAACGGCHNDIDWEVGDRLNRSHPDVQAGLLTRDELSDPAFRELFAGVLRHDFGNDQCTQCHRPDTPSLDPAEVHIPPLLDEENVIGLRVDILSVTGNSGSGFFRPGDVPVVRFDLFDESGARVNIADVAAVNMVVSGPVENYQKIIPTAAATLSLKGSGGVPTSGLGPFTHTSAEAIPAVYPPPLNDSDDFDFDGGWGELSGLPLLDGSYTVMMFAYRQFDLDEMLFRETSQAAVLTIRIGRGGVALAYSGVVTDAKCNTCHGDLRFHGNTRKGVEGCVTCHTAGAEDRPFPVAGQTQSPVPDSIDFKIMIHRIHNARDLASVQDGEPFDLIGFSPGDPSFGRVIDFSTALLPTMPGGAKHCTACHATDAWKDPVERPDVSIWKVACTSCHDSTAANVHVALNTLRVGLEGCAVCHGPGATFSVERVHKPR